MTIFHLVTDAGRQAGSASAQRPASRRRAHLKLVSDNGAAPGGGTSAAAPLRRHSALTLAVAAAAIAAAGVTTAFLDRDSAAGRSGIAMSIRSLL